MDHRTDEIPTPKPETPESTEAVDDIKKKRLEQLKKLKEKMTKGISLLSSIYTIASKYNSKAVELEAKRINSDSYSIIP